MAVMRTALSLLLAIISLSCSQAAPRGRLDDLTAPSADILRHSPGVADVEVLVPASKPTHRIIHLQDWHWVPRDLFAADVRRSAGKPLSNDEVDALYEQHLDEVELAQKEQVVIIGTLGVTRILAEGFTKEELANFHDVKAAIRDVNDRLHDLVRERAKVRVRRLGGGTTEYIRVATSRYKEFAGQNSSRTGDAPVTPSAWGLRGWTD
jgi:hypothetical protein